MAAGAGRRCAGVRRADAGIEAGERHAGELLAVFLYWAIPLAVLALVAGRHWTALFRRLRGVDVLWMIGFAILNLIVTLLVGQITIRMIDTTANQAVVGASFPVAELRGK
jgi:hypothetical protein